RLSRIALDVRIGRYAPLGLYDIIVPLATGGTATLKEQVNVIRFDLVGGFGIGSIRRATVIPLPEDKPDDPTNPNYRTNLGKQIPGNIRQAYRAAFNEDLAQATHLLIPSDCMIDGAENQNVGLIFFSAGGMEAARVVSLDGKACILVSPTMFSEGAFVAMIWIVNQVRALFGLDPIDTNKLYQQFISIYNIPPAEAAKKSWWVTPAFTKAGVQWPLVAEDKNGRKIAEPIVIIVKQPIRIIPPAEAVRRFEKYEADVVLDNDYFHHSGPPGQGMTQQDRFDAYDADRDGERIAVDARFRMKDGEGDEEVTVVRDGKAQVYDVPCFAMKEKPDGPFRWKVRFSPPHETVGTERWEMTVRAVVWHKARGDTPGNYDEFNQIALPNGSGLTYYHYYGYNADGDDPAFKTPGNQHKDDRKFYRQIDPLTGNPFDKDLPVPKLKFRCGAATGPGPVRVARASEDKRFFHRDMPDGTSAPTYLFGLCRFVNLKETDQPANTFWQSGWVDMTSEVLAPLRDVIAPGTDDTKNFTGLLSIWLFTPDSSLVHARRGDDGEYFEEWNGFASADRDISARMPMPEGKDVCMYFDQGRADMLDKLFDAAGEKGVKLMVTLWGHGDLRHGWPEGEEAPVGVRWRYGQWGEKGLCRTNPWYLLTTNVSDFIGASETNPIWDHQRNYYRYLIARYSGHPSLGLWEGVSEYAGIQGLGVSDTQRVAFMDRLCAFFRSTDPHGHPISSSSQGWGTPTYLSGDYSSTHAYGRLTGGQGVNLANQLPLANDATFREDVVRIAGVLPGEASSGAPWFHGEAAAIERRADVPVGHDPDDLLKLNAVTKVDALGTRIFKGITYYHYVLMYDLLAGAAGTPLKWNDAKEFGEMMARSSAPGSPDYCKYFDAANYKPHYFNAVSYTHLRAH
ncbi:MAG: hypothetical protein N3A38_14775, partial [Planctomycetota bacterium]|nr:hypothetical protein [Planctomycetota bacterium]